MLKVFIEYKVAEEQHDRYLALIPQMKERMREANVADYRLFTGTDQPLLFVEEFTVADAGQYEEYKKYRLSGEDPLWRAVHDCVAGGAAKVHIWAFREIG